MILHVVQRGVALVVSHNLVVLIVPQQHIVVALLNVLVLVSRDASQTVLMDVILRVLEATVEVHTHPCILKSIKVARGHLDHSSVSTKMVPGPKSLLDNYY